MFKKMLLWALSACSTVNAWGSMYREEVEALKSKAQAGDAQAQYDLGSAYYFDEIIEENSNVK